MALFDNMQKQVFSATERLFGDSAEWQTANDAHSIYTCLVLFRSPNDPYRIGKTDKYEYLPYNYSFEYYVGNLPGLKESVDAGTVEYVTVCRIKLSIREVKSKDDGKTYIAYGELDNE